LLEVDVFFNIRKLLANLKKKYFRLESHSQLAEDRIIEWALNLMDIEKPTYLDIGANHPRYLSNTYFFYKKGCRGVCIEPNPILCKELTKSRRRDVCIQAGILPSGETEMPFFVMSADTLSTFSEQDAESFQRQGYRIFETIKVPIVDINKIIQEYFDDRPDFISIDVEGSELEIIKSVDCRPPLWCVETLNFEPIEKAEEIIEYLVSKGYTVFADTFLNTIFVDSDVWNNRKK
jgi:FkbM family methyltransferase